MPEQTILNQAVSIITTPPFAEVLRGLLDRFGNTDKALDWLEAYNEALSMSPAAWIVDGGSPEQLLEALKQNS